MPAYRVWRADADQVDVLVLGADLRQALVAVRALGRAGRSVGAVALTSEPDVPALHSRWCRLALSLVHPAIGPDDFMAGLLAVVERYGVRVVLPADDGVLKVLSQRRAELEAHCLIALAHEPALSLLDSKEDTLALAVRLGIPVPEGILVQEEGQLDDVAERVGFPAVVKPAESWPVPRAGEAGQRLFCHGVSSKEELQAVAAAMLEVGGRPIVQPWLPGAREAVSLFVADGRVLARFAQVAYRMMPPLGGSSIYRKSIPPPSDATSAAESLVLTAGLDGYAEVEFRRDADGRAVLMEVNPRLSASVEIAIRAGVDFPALAVALAEGTTLRSFPSYRTGVRMRWLGGDLEWLYRSVSERGGLDVPTPLEAARELVASTFRPTGYDYLGWSDPRPAWYASARFAKAAARRLAGPSGNRVNLPPKGSVSRSRG